ncbi:MAG: hypothetical protein LKF70_10190 [Prevotella sp.]|jgi:hypothetical protein|nr:hypothetical protein [Prevotella sp.]
MPFFGINGFSHYAVSVQNWMLFGKNEPFYVSFKALTVAWSDGKTVFVLKQCILGEKGK